MASNETVPSKMKEGTVERVAGGTSLSEVLVRNLSSQGYSGGEVTVSGDENDPLKPLTTTISTIAVQSGQTRIVIALLQSKDWLQLKIQEMQPAMTEIGANLEEALILQQQHQEALEKLQTKQSPVEELLNQADELISNQKPRAEVYSAMAENLGLAWKDLNAQLDQRRVILEQAVAFHTRAKDFSERMDQAHREFSDTFLPDNADACRSLLERIHDVKKAILEGSMRTLSEGQSLLERLCEVATHSMGDSRPAHMRHVAQQTCQFVEQYMENLHDRRRHLEAMFLQRKIKLEQCLQMCLIYHDINEIKQFIQTKGAEHKNNPSLGDSAATAEILQHEHVKFQAEAKDVQDRAIRLLKTAEQLSAGGHYAGEEIQTRAYETLEECTELLSFLENRHELLSMAVSFFNAAQTALNKLDQIEVQVTTDSSRINSNLSQTIDEITGPALKEGYALLDAAGRHDPGSQGVARKVAELENRRIKLNSLCSVHDSENQERQQAFKKFMDCYNILKNWLVNVGQACLQGHQDMGSVLAMAKDFLERHERLQNDLRLKAIEVDALLTTVPALIRNGGEEAETIHQKAEELRQGWDQLRTLLETRILLAQRYLAFHKLATQLGKEMDGIEDAMKGDKTQFTESVFRQHEERWVSVQQMILQFNNTGKNFIADAKKVQDPYLDTQRAIVCVENLLEQVKLRKDAFNSLWGNWKVEMAEGKEQRTQWDRFTKEARKTMDDVHNFEASLFPVIPVELHNVDSISEHLERTKESLDSKLTHAYTELDVKRKTTELFTLKEIQPQKDKLQSEISNRLQFFQSKMTEYAVLLSMMISFFKNFKELEKILGKQDTQYKTALLTSEYDRAEATLREHEANKHSALDLIRFSRNEADQVINQINAVEPPMAAAKDKDKINTLLESREKGMDTIWEEHKKRLEQNLQYCHFTRDLQEINHHLDTLQHQLNSMRGKYGESLPAAKVTSVAFVQFEKTLELLEIRIRQFVSTAQKMLNDQHVESRSIHNELQNVQTKWSTFHTQVGDNRKLINVAIEYFDLVAEADEWFREGSQVLISIARKSTGCRTPQEANSLLNEVEQFLKPGERRQQERIDKISSLAIQLYGDPSHTSTMQVSGKNRDMLDSFAVINDELSTLAVNLKVAEQDRAKEKREKEDAEDALRAAQAEATAARAAMAAAQEAARASEAMAKTRPVVREAFQQTVMFKQETTTRSSKQGLLPKIESPKPPRIQMPSPPVFVVPLSNATMMEGSKVTFECKVEGFPTPYVQWLKDGILIQNNPDYVTSFEDGVCKLSIEETFADDSAKFSCKATNAAGTAETQGSLTVKESRPHQELIAPQFTKEMMSGNVQEGQPHQFDCTVIGHPLPLVSWFKNDVCIDNSPDYVMSAINGECTIQIKEATLDDDGRFTCRATNPVGQAVCSAKLSVTPLATISAPVVLTPLSNVMARAGQKLRLECRVKGEPLPTITWLHNNKVIKDNRDAKLQYDGDRAVLVITEAFPKDAGTYQVLAKNDAGDAASSCNVLVKGRLPMETSDSELASDMEPIKPQVMKHLTDQTVNEGSRTRMDCVIVGQPEPEVIWYHNGKPVKESDDFQLLFEGDACTLIIKEAYLEDSGDYKCVAINSGGEASTHCTLIIDPLSEVSDVERSQRDALISVERGMPPRFSKLLSDYSVGEGYQIALECQAVGDPEPSVSWFKNDKSLDDSNHCQIHRQINGKSTLSIAVSEVSDSGFYSVKASNKCGQAKCFCTVTVSPKKITPIPLPKPSLDIAPSFTQHIQDSHVPKGQEAQFVCAVAGLPKPEVKWSFRGWPIQPDAQHKIEEKENTHKLTLPQVRSQDSGRYSVTAENNLGQSTSSATLTVEEPFLEQPFQEQQLQLLDGFTEQKVHSSVMTKKTSIMQQSRISSVTQQFDSGSTVQVHQTSSVEKQGMSIVSGQPTQSYHSQERSEFHQNLNHGIPEFKPLSLPGVLSGSIERSVLMSQPELPPAIQAPITIAPRFSRPVTSALVNEGDAVTLEGQIEGHPEPVVKWFKNGIELVTKPGCAIVYENGKTTLKVLKSTEKDSARYSCTATNAAGSATSSADVVIKPYRVPARFVQRLSPAVVKSGDRVVLEVQVEGHPAPEVTWFKNEVLLKNTPDTRIKSDGQHHSLTIAEAFPDDAGKIMVKAINAAGEAHSIANLIVEEDVSPNGYKEFTVVEQKHEFQSKMTKTKAENITQLSYQQVRQEPLASPQLPLQFTRPSPTASPRPTTLEPLYPTPTASPKPPPPIPPPKPVAAVESKLFRASKVVGSAKIGPVVEDSCDEDEPFMMEPLRVNVSTPEPVHPSSFGLLKQASPMEPITINMMDYHESVSRQETIRTSVQSTPKSSPRPILIKDSDSAHSSPRPKKEVVIVEQPIMATEIRPPIFSVPLKELLLKEGQNVTMECQVEAHPMATFRWFRGSIPILSSSDYNITSSENSSTLTIGSVQLQDNSTFTCTAVNAGGSKSSTAQITVESLNKGMVIQPPPLSVSNRRPPNASPPVFERPPVAGRFIEGGDAHFECQLRGNPPPEVVWSRRGMPIRNDHRRQVSYNPQTGICTLNIKNLTADDDGDYNCTAVNCAGEASLIATIQRGQTDRAATHTREAYSTHTTQMWGAQNINQQQTFSQQHFERRMDTTLHRAQSNEYNGEPGSPLYYSGVEEAGFRVDTFEYRLLREIEFRESITRRQLGEPEPQPALVQPGPPSAPQILQRPRNSKLLEGSDATFQARIHGNPQPGITWFKNGQRLLESQRTKMTYVEGLATLHIHMALPEDAGYYTLLSDNDNGHVACSAHLVIEALGSTSDSRFTSLHRMDSTGTQRIDTSASTKVTQVVDNEVDSAASRSLKPNFVKVPSDKEVTEGKMIRFDCRVTGRPFPDVLWYHDEKQVVDDARHKILVNEGGVHSLMITVSSVADHGRYTCVARNKSGEVSFTVHLTVIEKEQVVAPKFVERFQSTHVREREPVTLHCRAVGTPIPKMTWQKDGIQIHSIPPNMIIETQDGSSTIYFNNVSIYDSAWYQCTAQNSAGSTATRARLCVDSEKKPLPEPWRLYLPRPHKVIEPARSPPRETIWLRHVERSAPHVPLQEEQAPPQKPAFTTHLQDLQVHEGERAHFDARLVPIGDATMTVEWFVNGKPLVAGSRVMTTYRFGYVALTLLHVYSEDSGVYTCRAVNEAGEAVTTATLKCTTHPTIDKTPQHPDSMEAIQHLEDWEKYKRQESVDETVSLTKPNFIRPLNNLENMQEGGYAHFEAQITPVNDPTMKIEWFFNGQVLTAGSRISTTFSFGYVALNISSLRSEDSGVYMCKATNIKGEAFSTATLKIRVTSQIITDLGFPEQQQHIDKIQELEAYQLQQSRKVVETEVVTTTKPSFKSQLKDLTNLQEGRTAHFEARLEPTGDSTMRIEWYKDGRVLEASSRITTFFNFGYVSLTIKGLDTRDEGVYTCVAINVAGKAQSSAKLFILKRKDVDLTSQYEGLEKIQHLEDSSRYKRDVTEETSIREIPKFTQPLMGQENLVEGRSVHFETRLEPMGDPAMQVDWFHNGRPLTTGHRFKTYFDFGYVALDILYLFPQDTGTYTIRAKNQLGEAQLTKNITVTSKSNVDYSAIHDISIEEINRLERHHTDLHYFVEEVAKCKPNFTVPLKDPKPLRESESVHLECRVEPLSDPTMKVEWYFNGRPLTTGHRYRTYFEFGYVALDILTAYPEDSGEYTVRATNHLGSSHTSSCVKIYEKSAIITESLHYEGLEQIRHLEDSSRYKKEIFEDTIITQVPAFTKPLHNLDTMEGSNIHLECRLVPVGDDSLTVEWFHNGQPIRVGHKFRPAHEFDYVALDILSIYPEDSGVYTCKARSRNGEAVTSCSVKCLAKSQIILESQHPGGLEQIQYLEDSSRYRKETIIDESVKVRPRFLSTFKKLIINEGQTAHFESRLEPMSDSTLRVEWFRNGKQIPVGHRFRPFHDFGYVALNIISAVPEDNGTYTCRATNALGTHELSATLEVQGKSSIISDTQHPEGLQKIHRLEQHKQTRETYEEEIITQAPVFTSAPKNVEVKESESVHFECRIIPVGDNKLKVEWFHNEKPLKTGSRFMETNSFGFVALDIKYAMPEDSGVYTCKASNALGQAVTSCNLRCISKKDIILDSQVPESLAKIQQLESYNRQQRRPSIEDTTTQAPVFTTGMKNLNLVENHVAHFECRLIPVSDPKLKVEWFFNGLPLQSASRVTTLHDFGYVALDLKNVKPEDSGTYTCKAVNELGQALCNATLNVRGTSSLLLDSQNQEALQKIQYLEGHGRYQREEIKEIITTENPVFITPLRGQTQLNEGQSCHMECRISPYPDSTMKVEWFRNDIAIQTGHRFRTMYDFGIAALDILHMYGEDSGEYVCKATNHLGSATSSLKVNCKSKSNLILEPQQPGSIPRIRELEDLDRYRRTEEPEPVYDQKPNFVRPLYNLENLVEGQKAHLEATMTPVNDPSMKVEWFLNGIAIGEGSRYKVTNDFGFVALDITFVKAEDSGTYMCKASNKIGEAVTTSTVRIQGRSGVQYDTLHEESLEKIRALESHYVKPREEPPIQVSRPVFLKPLNSQDNIVEGLPVHLETRLEPINDPKLKVQWYVNGIEIKTGHRFRTTHDFGYVAMDILYSYAEDSGTYMCKAVNELGEAVTTCSVKVQAKKNIYYDTQHPEGLEKIRELESQSKFTSYEIEEKPISRPVFISELRGKQDLDESQKAHFEGRVEPSHDPNLKIEFFHDGKPISAGSRIHITFDFGYLALDFAHVYPEDSGLYTAKASNRLGECTSSITLQVHGKTNIILDSQNPDALPKIEAFEDDSRYKREEFIEPRTFQRPVFTVPLANLDNLVEGQSAHMECRLIPVGDPTLKVEWYFNNKPLQVASRFKLTHDFGYVSMDIQYVRPDDAGVYMCRASNELGEAVTTASVRIKSHAVLQLETQHPEGLEKIRQLEDSKGRTRPDEPDTVFERPVFTMPLTGPRELVEGQPAHFECRAIPVGDPHLRFEWYVNGIELKTGSRFRVTNDFGFVSIDIASTIPEDSGLYMCKAVNLHGEAVTTAALNILSRSGVLSESQHPESHLKTQKFEYDASRIPEYIVDTTPGQPPVFTQNLVSQDRLVEGQPIHLEARVQPANDEKLKVEWFKNGKTLVLGSRIRTALDFGLVTLDIAGVRPDDSGMYTCRAFNQLGEAISTCTLKVVGVENIAAGAIHPGSLPKIQQLESQQYPQTEYPDDQFPPPIFVSHLNNLQLYEDEVARLQCQVQPAKDPSLTIEFLQNGKPVISGTRITINNDFGFVYLDISHVILNDNGIYSCVARNKSGEAVTTGSIKVLELKEKMIPTLHPRGLEGLERLQQTEQAILSRSMPTPDAGDVVYPKPWFIRPLQPKFTVNEGYGTKLECQVEPAADTKLTIEWFINGKPLFPGTRYAISNDFGNVVLEVTDLWPRDNGVYTCRAHNDYGEAFTTTTIEIISKSTVLEGTLHPEGERGLESIQVLEDSLIKQPGAGPPDFQGHPPIFTSQFENLTNLNPDDIAHFEATLTPVGDQTMVVEWFFNNKQLPTRHNIRTVHAFGMVVLEILGVYPEDSGQYTCRATNKWGRAEITVTLECVDREMGQKPRFTTQLKSMIGLKEGVCAHFECNLIPVGDPKMRVEWFHNGIPMRDSSRIKTLSDFGFVVMDISFVHEEDSGEYVCVATNNYGSDTTRCTIQCTGHGKIFRESLQPQSLDKIAELEGSNVVYRSQYTTEYVAQAPKFETQIQSLTSLVETQSAHFEARLIPVNDPTLVVEWFFNGTPLKAGHRFRTFHDFGIVILDILYCYGEDTGEYVCKATNRLGTDVTRAKIVCRSKASIILDPQLPVEMAGGNERIMQLEDSLHRSRSDITLAPRKDAPRFTVPLENLPSLREGENAHFEAKLTPTDDPDLVVEWFKNGKPIRAGTRIRTIHDFGFVVLEISPVYPEDSGVYSCRANNRVGEAVTSCSMNCESRRSIILDSQLPKGMESGMEKIAKFEEISDVRIAEQWVDVDTTQPPVFLTQPKDLALQENALAHWECRLAPIGDPSMKVEWFHNGKSLITGSRVKTISDFGFVILEVAGVYPRDNGVYSCKATNKNGEATVSTRLTVKSRQSVVLEPQLPKEWQTGTKSLQKLEETLYHVEEHIMDEDKKQPPKFITQIEDLLAKVEGDSSHFECRLTPVGDPTMRVEWFHNGKPLTTGSRVHTVDDFGFVVLEIDWLFPRDSGEYLCRATNKYGSDTTKAQLKIKGKKDIIMDSQLPQGMSAESLKNLEQAPRHEAPMEEAPPQPPKFITQIQALDNLNEGDSAHFECRLEPVNDPHLRVEWYHNGKPLRSGHRYKTTHDFGFVALDILYVYPEDSGEYTARAFNKLGEDVTKSTIKCKGKPSLEYRTQLPTTMKDGVRKIAAMESSRQRVGEEEELEQERSPPLFIMKPEPQVVIEGEWAKFCARVSGYPRPRVMWILNGNTVISGSRYKLSYDGIYHLDVPKSRQYDHGKIELYARNAMGEAYCWTTLEVRPKYEDYRAVLKNSPRPWYDTQVKRYQNYLHETELERRFDEKLTPGGTQVDIWKAVDQKGEHVKVKEHLSEEETKAMIPEVHRYKSDSFHIDEKTGEKVIDQQSQVNWMAKTYEENLDKEYPLYDPMSPESIVHGREVVSTTQKQTQKEIQGDLEYTRNIAVKETLEQEHKAHTKERKVTGPPVDSKPPVFSKKIQPCRVYEGETAKFECKFTGKPAPSVTWMREQFPITSSPDFQIITTESTSTLAIKEVYLEDSGVFTVVAENRSGSAKTSANLVVEERREQKSGVIPPSFTRTAQDTTAKVGQLARLDARITGSKPMDVYWYKNGKKMAPNITHKLFEEDDQNTLLILEATPEDSGNYECVAINQAGEARCQAVVTIDSPAGQAKPTSPTKTDKATKTPALVEPLKDITVKEGQPANFKTKITGVPAPQVKWFRGDNLVKQSRYFRMTVEKDIYSLKISEAFPEDEGTYKCVASNPAGNVTTTGKLKVLVPDVNEVPPTLSPLADLTVPQGTPARFVTSVTGTPTPKVAWFKEGKQIKSSRDFQMVQDGGSTSLVIRKTYPEDEGVYTCRATNNSGQAETSARLKVESKK